MEAEYIAASEAAKEAVWIRKFITGLGVVPSITDPVDLYCDNNGAIAQAKEPRMLVKRARSDNCFTFMEVSIESGIKSLKHLDSKKLKIQIKKWAKAVVTYARQVSDHVGSSRY
ncbi:hypothetical protein AgCh_006649 [Apium graveolens]